MTETKRNGLMIAGALLYAVLLWRVAIEGSALWETGPRSEQLIFALIVAGGVITALLALWGCDRSTAADLAVTGSRPMRALLVGLGSYAVPAALALGGCVVAGVIEVRTVADPMTMLSSLAMLAGLVFLAEALPEELVFRGLIQGRLGQMMGPWPAILVQAALFMLFALVIGAVEGLMDASFIATFGVVLGILRVVTGSLWAPIGFHLLFMTTQQAFGAGWGMLESSDPQLLQTLILAVIPFSVVIAVCFSRVGSARPERDATDA